MHEHQVFALPELGVDRAAHERVAAGAFAGWLLSGSGVVAGTSRDQAGDERSEQGFAASTRIVHELEEAEVKRQLLLRDAAVRVQPGTQQGPEAFMWTALE